MEARRRVDEFKGIWAIAPAILTELVAGWEKGAAIVTDFLQPPKNRFKLRGGD